MTTVVAYDIHDDRRRARVSASLQQWGDRLQRSVFLCTLESQEASDLLRRIGDMIDPDTDSVYAFRQCAACWDQVRVLGQATVQNEPLYWSVL